MIEELKESNSWTQNFKEAWDAYYLTSEFKELLLSKYRRAPTNFSYQIFRRDDSFFQQGVNGDLLIKFSDGNRIVVDEKMRRPKHALLNNFVVETVSVQPKNGGDKKLGWGYKVGTTIVFGSSSPLENDLVKVGIGRPLFYTISERFVNEITRSNVYPNCPVENRTYWTINKLVPRMVLETYRWG